MPTHVGALVEYTGGAAASLLFSFDSPLPRHGFVEITGTEATMAVPDPNRFTGDIRTGWPGRPARWRSKYLRGFDHDPPQVAFDTAFSAGAAAPAPGTSR